MAKAAKNSKKDILQRIDSRLDELGISAEAACKAAGVGKDVIRDWHRKTKTMPRVDTLEALAEPLHVRPEWLLTGVNPPAPTVDRDGAMVRVVGYVGAGAAAHYYAVAQGDLDEVPAPEGATADTVAVEIRGNSLGELFDRWLVFYDQVRRPVTPDLIGRLCVVGLADERVLVKKLRRGRDGLFDLFSNTEEPIRGVAVEWAARVLNMAPR